MATHTDLVNFYFDIEATDLGKESIIGHYLGPGVDYQKRQRLKRKHASNITEIFGETADGAKIELNMPFYDGDEALKKLIDDISIEFEYAEGGQTKVLSHNQIMDYIEGNQIPDFLSNKKGKFRTGSDEKTIEALRKLTYLKQENPTRGMFGLEVTQIGGTLNKILAKNIFDVKTGNIQTDREAGINRFLDHLSYEKRNAIGENKKLAINAWNASYDMRMLAEHIDELAENGNTALRDKFKQLFNSHDEIRIVEASDKFRDIMFKIDQYSEANHFMNTNHQQVKSTIEGENTTKNITIDKVKSQLKEEVVSNKRGTYVKENTFLKNLAKKVGDLSEAGAASTKDEIAESIIDNLKSQRTTSFHDRSYELATPDSVERQVVDKLSQLVKDLINPVEGRGSTETLRRSLREIESLGHSDISNDIINRAFLAPNQNSLNERIIQSLSGRAGQAADPESAVHVVEKFMKNSLGGTLPDFMGGFSLSSGNTGLLGSIITAKETYTETLNGLREPISDPLKSLFDSIEGQLREPFKQLKQTGGHAASIDVNNMARIVEGVLTGAEADLGDQQVRQFMSEVFEINYIKTAEERLDSTYLGVDNIDEVVRKHVKSQVFMPDEQVMDPPGRNLSGESRSLGSVDSAFKGKTAMFAKSALVLSGLVLLSNRNGDIKHQGSKYNTLEGMSPSGDPLIHSFGSGNSHYSNQALNSLQYGFNLNSDTLRSSMLGYKGDRLANQLMGRSTFDDYTNSSERGNIIHKIIEQEYLQKKLAQNTEHYIYSAELNVVGHVDIILNSGAPLEIKTVEDFKSLKELNAPKDHHVSQANFYAYALNQPYALIGYAARNDPTKIKYFKIDTDINRVMQDVQTVRGTVDNLRAQGHSIATYPVYQQMKDTYRNMTQNKYARNPGVFTGMQNGMVHSAEMDNHYSAIKGLGDYKQVRKNTGSFRGSADPRAIRRNNRNRSSEGRGPSGNKTSHLFAGIIKTNQRQSGYHPGSRVERTATASSY